MNATVYGPEITRQATELIYIHSIPVGIRRQKKMRQRTLRTK